MQDMTRIHEMWQLLMDMGATEEDCIKVIKVAFEVTNKIVNEQGVNNYGKAD